ncbi:MAG: single-stranded DNA-binding protein [Gemmatimonadetes bacterium]|nr:single-stranded DNA-binding protein [Gemmatimonadota bacterium]
MPQDSAAKLVRIARELSRQVGSLEFLPPIRHVYNPLEYAWKPHRLYLELYGKSPKEIVLVGMNPGPWGMAQTGIPFGDVEMVRGWLGIEAEVGKPPGEHPKRRIRGFACPRREVSGTRFWGWAQRQFGTAERFFARFFVHNYCPLLFLDAQGRNLTPERLRTGEREFLFDACDRALRRMTDLMRPRFVIGVGRFAERRALEALASAAVMVGRIPHPSPANPSANRGWEDQVARELSRLGILD